MLRRVSASLIYSEKGYDSLEKNQELKKDGLSLFLKKSLTNTKTLIRLLENDSNR